MAGPYDIAGNFQPMNPGFALFQVLSSPPVAVSVGRSYFDLTLGMGVYANGIWNYASGGGGGTVTSVFGRPGPAIVAASGDYTFAQIGSTPTTVSGYGITDALTSASNLAWAKVTGAPTTTAGYGITDAVTLTGAQTLTNKTLTTPVISSISNTGTLTLPTSTDTLVGKATTDILTNKTFNTAGAGNVLQINGTGITAVTGTGSAVLATSPTLVTPTIGVAVATSVNKVTITAPTTSSTLTLVDGSTLATSGANSITLTSTGTTTVTLPTTGTLATLSGTETFANKTFSNAPTFGSLTNTNGVFYGNGSGVLQQSANLTFSSANNGLTLTTPAIGVTGTDANGLILQNTTAATVSLLQYSPALSFDANGWNTTGSVTVPFAFRFVLAPLSASTNQANFLGQFSINGAAYGTSFFVTQAGTFNATALSATNAVSGSIFKFKTSVNSGTTLTLTTSAMVWIFTGSSATTWTLPALAGNTDVNYLIKNRGTATITLTRAGSDNLYSTASVTTFTINPGDGIIVTNDGSFWLIY